MSADQHPPAGRRCALTFNRPFNILVMDGDARRRAETCATLARASHRSLGVADAQAALSAARVEAVDVALLDLGASPDASALWLARSLRDQVGDLAVVLLTRSSSLDAALDAMRLGVLDCLFKPFSTADLVESVDRAVQWRRAAIEQRMARRQVEHELGCRLARLRATVADAAIASTPALDLLVSSLYAGNRSALEHARRVSFYAVGLASLLGVTGSSLADVEHGGLLHDIGKLVLPERITAKPTPLTDHERAVFRTHTDFAAELIWCMPPFRGAATIVASVRERYEGSGYPGRLRHDAIPLGSRVVAIAELFDSLTGAGLAGDPMTVAAANAQLVRAAGTWFDPFLVAAWLRYAGLGLPHPPHTGSSERGA